MAVFEVGSAAEALALVAALVASEQPEVSRVVVAGNKRSAEELLANQLATVPTEQRHMLSTGRLGTADDEPEPKKPRHCLTLADADALLRAKADPQTSLDENLYWAADAQRIDHVRALLGAGARPDGYLCRRWGRTTALVSASMRGGATIARLLLGAGACTSSHSGSDWPALTWACCRGHLAVVQALLSAGADPNQRSASGVRAIHLPPTACRLPPVACCLPPAACLLSSHRAYLPPCAHLLSPTQLSPLSIAALYGRASIVPTLLDAGASADALCNRGWSALRYATIARGDTRDAIIDGAAIAGALGRAVLRYNGDRVEEQEEEEEEDDEEDAASPQRQEVVWALVNAKAALRSLDDRALQRVLRVLGAHTSSATANDRSEDQQSCHSALVSRVLAAAPPPAAARKHIAAFRIHRFLRDAFFNPSYAFARRFVARQAGVSGAITNIETVDNI